MKFVLFFTLAGLGAALRWGLVNLESRFFDSRMFSLSVLIVNIFGSYAMGWIYTAQQNGRLQWSDFFTMCLMVALLGSLTTFSTFALDTVKMLQNGEWFLASTHVLLTNSLCLFFCYLGVKSALAMD